MLRRALTSRNERGQLLLRTREAPMTSCWLALALPGKEQEDCIGCMEAPGAEVCSAWRDLGGQGTLGLLRSRWSSGWYLPQPRTWTPTPQSTDDRGRARAEEQNVPDGGAASPHQGAPETPRQRGLYGQLSLSRLPPPAWCCFPHPEVMPWGPLELRQQPRTISGWGLGVTFMF